MARYTEADKERVRQLKAEGLSHRKIGDMLGIGRRTIDTWFPSENGSGSQPPAQPLEDGLEGAAGGSGHQPAGEQPPTRVSERAPRKPAGARVQARPAAADGQLDFVAITTYIEGAYKLGGKVAKERGDELLGSVIDEHAGAAAKAWVRYIQSEPKVAAMLQRLMVGTPAGEVIAIHVSIVFSYTLARGAAAHLAAEARAAAEAEAAAARAHA